MTKKELTKIFTDALKMKSDICVAIHIDGQKEPEYIVNKNSSIENKLKYYLEAYDDNLIHKHNSEIYIVNAFPIDFYMGE